MWNWLKKSWAAGKSVLGKVKGGLDYGLRLFQKGKDAYQNVRNTLTNLPIVGTVAENLINKGESAANQYAKEKTGYNMGDVNKAAGLAKNISNLLPMG
jgi:hypothetical protein